MEIDRLGVAWPLPSEDKGHQFESCQVRPEILQLSGGLEARLLRRMRIELRHAIDLRPCQSPHDSRLWLVTVPYSEGTYR